MRPLNPADWSGSRILLVAPHPDDEVLGCGGTVSLAAGAGAHVHVVVLASGSPGIDGDATPEQRVAEARAACGLLGLSPPTLMGATSADVRRDPRAWGQRIARVFPEHEFEVVLAPWPLERHATHRATLLAALHGAPSRQATRWFGYGVWDPIPAGPQTVEVDVTTARAGKTRALAAHASQNQGRSLTAGMTSRDLDQAVFSRITGPESRRAVERLLDLGDLASRVRAAEDPSEAVCRWAVEREQQRVTELWGPAPPVT